MKKNEIIKNYLNLRLNEFFMLIRSTIKWCLFSIITGTIVGSATSMFLKTLDISIASVQKIKFFYFFLPFVFLLNTMISNYQYKKRKDSIGKDVVEAIHKKHGRVDPLKIFVNIIFSLITISFGGSAGKEAPSLQLGAGVISFFERFFKIRNEDCKKLVIAGMSSAFSVAFGAPVASAVFCIEFLFVGKIQYDAILPSVVASISGFYTSKLFNITHYYKHFNSVQPFNGSLILKIIMLAIVFGIVALLFIFVMESLSQLYKKIHINSYVKALIGGILLILMVFVFKDKYLSLGTSTIEQSLNGAPAKWYDFILKSVFTGVTLNFGGSGGEVTPLFFIGATSGSFFGSILKIDTAMASALGICAVFSGATNTPIASSILAIELFGISIAPYAALVSVISFVVTGYRSIYTSQIISMVKTPSLDVEEGIEIKHARAKPLRFK